MTKQARPKSKAELKESLNKLTAALKEFDNDYGKFFSEVMIPVMDTWIDKISTHSLEGMDRELVYKAFASAQAYIKVDILVMSGATQDLLLLLHSANMIHEMESQVLAELLSKYLSMGENKSDAPQGSKRTH